MRTLVLASATFIVTGCTSHTLVVSGCPPGSLLSTNIARHHGIVTVKATCEVTVDTRQQEQP